MAKGGGHGKGQKMPYRVVRAFAGESVRRSAHWGIGAAQADMRMTLLAANAGRLVLAEGEISIIDVRTDEVVDRPLKCLVCDEQWATESGPGRRDEPSTCRDCEGMDELDDSDQDVLAPDLPYTPPAMPTHAAAEKVEAISIRLGPPEGHELIVGRSGHGKTSVAAIAEAARLTLAEPVVLTPALEAAVLPFVRTNTLPDADPSGLLAALDRLNIERAVWSDGTVAAVANGMLWTMQAEPNAVTGEPCGVWSVASPEAVRGHFMPDRAARFIRDRRTP